MDGITTLSQQSKEIGPQRIVVEATGGYETKLIERLCTANLSTSHLNPLRVRRYAEGTNWFAKTDKIDAIVLANFGEKANPRLSVLPGEAEKRLAALLKRRKQVLDMLTAEKNRPENTDPDIREYIKSIIATLKEQLAELDRDTSCESFLDSIASSD